ncbi:hypothetical protein D9758_000943 [Tetrapyrgos nigripes]|uniref:Uncharacterized protein n=1 Tax=Tetrapyrgos nigripes TaxID=182062 RepID=A0A8H5GZI6_9AGAR|nr:hypothetical protein D9758_000943 [Tetrapyrgos nigripes]
MPPSCLSKAPIRSLSCLACGQFFKEDEGHLLQQHLTAHDSDRILFLRCFHTVTQIKRSKEGFPCPVGHPGGCGFIGTVSALLEHLTYRADQKYLAFFFNGPRPSTVSHGNPSEHAVTSPASCTSHDTVSAPPLSRERKASLGRKLDFYEPKYPMIGYPLSRDINEMAASIKMKLNGYSQASTTQVNYRQDSRVAQL